MFKKVIASLMCVVLAAGCADNRDLKVPGKGVIEVETYGFLNEDELKQECVDYSLSTGNVVWSVLLSGGLVFPVYFVGFSLYEPDGINQECLEKFNKSLAESTES